MWSKEKLWEMRKEIKLNSIYVNDYVNSFGVTTDDCCNFFDGFIEYIAELAMDKYGAIPDNEWYDRLFEFDTPDDLWDWYYCFDENPLKVKYKVLYGNGTSWLSEEIVELDEVTTDYDMIIDMTIDQIEARGEDGVFINWEDTVDEGGEYHEDEYVVGGNHGRILLHHGNLDIQLMSESE